MKKRLTYFLPGVEGNVTILLDLKAIPENAQMNGHYL